VERRLLQVAWAIPRAGEEAFPLSLRVLALSDDQAVEGGTEALALEVPAASEGLRGRIALIFLFCPILLAGPSGPVGLAV
jgi:hypothetical protein